MYPILPCRELDEAIAFYEAWDLCGRIGNCARANASARFTAFSVVDAGGNRLRISKTDDTERRTGDAESGLAKFLEAAARLRNSHGDEAAALKTLEQGLKRHPDASVTNRARCFTARSWRCIWGISRSIVARRSSKNENERRRARCYRERIESND